MCMCIAPPDCLRLVTAYVSWLLTSRDCLRLLTAYVSWLLTPPDCLRLLTAYVSWLLTSRGLLCAITRLPCCRTDISIFGISWNVSYPFLSHAIPSPNENQNEDQAAHVIATIRWHSFLHTYIHTWQERCFRATQACTYMHTYTFDVWRVCLYICICICMHIHLTGWSES
jgi:hypothetical protein